ncbi:hypothetical protein [Lactiplantibacillus plantarum]|uniref:hypothetical protein n=1 Tax=Lactiplantibacillus plantarum TaxID=1590 RepID=UPI0009408C2C|nr:hypothetical protein [Lactiplantibacillus plantarum]MBC6384219.1 hypothetical protein [Lactiplantibacillus plantarum]
MKYEDYVELGLRDDGQMKMILKGDVLTEGHERYGVVSVVFVTRDVNRAKARLEALNEHKKKDDYYMVYSCPEDTDLELLSHFPSIEITKEDLES